MTLCHNKLHEMTLANTRIRKDGFRSCVKCDRARHDRNQAKWRSSIIARGGKIVNGYAVFPGVGRVARPRLPTERTDEELD